jgi:hypothetical protein
MKRRTFLTSLALIPAIVACGSNTSAASITPFSGATPAKASDAPLAGELVAGLTSNINEKASAAATLYRLPDTTTYAAVKQYYADLLTAQGWQADPAILVEGDTLSYAAWKKDDQEIVIGVVENVGGDGAFMTQSVYRP